jgi:hypothetical protein
VSGTAQHGPVRQPHYDGGAGEENPMSRAHQSAQWNGMAGSQRQQQLRLESDMRELTGNDDTAEMLQAFAIRN